MGGEHRMKIGKRFLILLLLLAFLPLLSSLSKCGEPHSALPLAHMQMSSTVSTFVSSEYVRMPQTIPKETKIEYIHHHVFALAAYDFLSMDDNMMHLDHTQFQDHNAFDDGHHPGDIILVCVLLCGLVFVFLYFGTLSNRLFMCGFSRYTVIPHSIHAPPYNRRKTFEIFRRNIVAVPI